MNINPLHTTPIFHGRKEAIIHNASITKNQLISLLDAGKSLKEITRELQITDTTYLELLAKFGIKTKMQEAKDNISLITSEQLQRLVLSGKKVKEICEELNIQERTYSRLLDKFGIMSPRKAMKAHVATITADMLQNLVDEGFSPTEISEKLKIGVDMFYKLLKRLNINYNYQHHSNEVKISPQILAEMAESGKTTTEIASELGISGTTYHAKVKAANIKTVFRDSIDTIAAITKERIQELINKGLKIAEICQILNITNANYIALLRKYNLQTRQRQSSFVISAISKQQILELRDAGKSVKEICQQLHISQSTYRRILNSL